LIYITPWVAGASLPKVSTQALVEMGALHKFGPLIITYPPPLFVARLSQNLARIGHPARAMPVTNIRASTNNLRNKHASPQATLSMLSLARFFTDYVAQ
jgi:hypothetical protein